MPRENSTKSTISKPKSNGKAKISSKPITHDSLQIQIEEPPTIPLGSSDTLTVHGSLQPKISIQSVSATKAVNNVSTPLVAQASQYHPSLREWLPIWWNAIRPAYLLLSILPVFVGSTLAWSQSVSSKKPIGSFHPFSFIAVLVAVVAIQVGAHLINDYYDYLRGIDVGNALGPGGLIQQGLVKPVLVLKVGVVALILGGILGVLAAFSGGWQVYVLGLIGLLGAYFYSATSRSLSSSVLGEVVSFGIFGPVITLGAYMVQTGHADRSVMLYSLPFGFIAAAVIHLNNMRDLESDAQAKKHTIASFLGFRVNRVLYLALLVMAYATIIVLGAPPHTPHLILITLWTLPSLVVVVTGILCTYTSVGLHLVMRQTLVLEAYFTLWLVIALIASAIGSTLLHIR